MSKYLKIKNARIPLYEKDEFNHYSKVKIKNNYVPINIKENNDKYKSGIKLNKNFKSYDLLEDYIWQIPAFPPNNYIQVKFPDTYNTMTELPAKLLEADYSKIRYAVLIFSELTNLTKIPDTINISLANIETMYYLFKNCEKLESIPKLNFTNVKNLDSTFYNCQKLKINQVIDLDCDIFDNMDSCFYNCLNLTSLKFNFNNNGKGVNLNNVFNNCQNLINLTGNFNASNTNASIRTFYGCKSLSSNLENFTILNSTNHYQMFYDCNSIPEIKAKLDTVRSQSVKSMFDHCGVLKSIPVLNFSNVVDMSYCFQSCFALTSIPFEIDMTSCTYCTLMFNNCPATNIKLKNVPSSLDLSNIGTSNYTVLNYI